MQTFFETYLSWFTLREIPFLGNALYKKLLAQFGSPDMVFNAPESQLAKIDKISAKIIKHIKHNRTFKDRARQELDLIYRNTIQIITLPDPLYPPLLNQIPDPPPVLTYLGTLDNTAPCVSIVGSRTATTYGLNTAENLAARLAVKGFQIVSGMARGIDSMAHNGALKAKGKTIAVLGSGLNKIYPKENAPLFATIARNGTVFSEFKVNTEPFGRNFPVRNRIIAGLSCGTLVVEAAKRSGSLITARLAGEYNREVFAVPGSIQSKRSEGTHSLLKQGAGLVENEMDIIDQLYQFVHEKKEIFPDSPLQKQKSTQIKPTKQNRTVIIGFLEPYPVHIDVLIEKTGMDSSHISSQLLDLELEGIVKRHQGNYYSISEEYH